VIGCTAKQNKIGFSLHFIVKDRNGINGLYAKKI
jgi:hypothetical protein